MKKCVAVCGRFDSRDGKYQHKCVLPAEHAELHLFLCGDRTPWNEVDRLRAGSSKVRPLVLQRDRRTCQACGAKPPIPVQVDHIIELRHGGTNDPSNLWSLCGACHAAKTYSGSRHNPRARLVIAGLSARGYRASYTWCTEDGGHHHWTFQRAASAETTNS